MARSPSGRRGRGASDLGGTLSSLLRTTWEQAGAVREVLERGARTGRARLDEALSDRRRHAALAELGEIVLELVRRGEIDLEELPEISECVDALDQLDAEQERGGGARWQPSRDRGDDSDTIARSDDSSGARSERGSWRPPVRDDDTGRVSAPRARHPAAPVDPRGRPGARDGDNSERSRDGATYRARYAGDEASSYRAGGGRGRGGAAAGKHDDEGVDDDHDDLDLDHRGGEPEFEDRLEHQLEGGLEHEIEHGLEHEFGHDLEHEIEHEIEPPSAHTLEEELDLRADDVLLQLSDAGSDDARTAVHPARSAVTQRLRTLSTPLPTRATASRRAVTDGTVSSAQWRRTEPQNAARVWRPYDPEVRPPRETRSTAAPRVARDTQPAYQRARRTDPAIRRARDTDPVIRPRRAPTEPDPDIFHDEDRRGSQPHPRGLVAPSEAGQHRRDASAAAPGQRETSNVGAMAERDASDASRARELGQRREESAGAGYPAQRDATGPGEPGPSEHGMAGADAAAARDATGPGEPAPRERGMTGADAAASRDATDPGEPALRQHEMADAPRDATGPGAAPPLAIHLEPFVDPFPDLAPASPAAPFRPGGISFDDDDLADYMHPDDVPAREPG
jgi:hypothetical protein